MRWPAGRVLASIAIWAIHFGIAYGVTALACPRGNAGAVVWFTGIATAVGAMALLALILVPAVRGPRPYGPAQWSAALAGGAALAAILWQASPLLGAYPTCPS